jgi:hypothetical protein
MNALTGKEIEWYFSTIHQCFSRRESISIEKWQLFSNLEPNNPTQTDRLTLTDFIIATLIYHVSLSSRQSNQTFPYALIFWRMMDFCQKKLNEK